AMDLLAKRRPRWGVLLFTVGCAFGALAVHLYVGELVSMTAQPLGGSRLASFMTMGTVLLRYLVLLVSPLGLSVTHDVVPLQQWTPLALFGWLLFLGLGVSAVFFLMLKKSGRFLSVWIWCFAPLLPVSQFLVPLQNVMTDRYLFLSAMAPALVLGFIAERQGSLAKFAVASVLLVWAGFSSLRGWMFSDSELLFNDALAQTQYSPIPPYQLGMLADGRGDKRNTEKFFRMAINRNQLALAQDLLPHTAARRASNNLARLLVSEGRLGEAVQVLELARQDWPSDSKLAGNLLQVLMRQERRDEAEVLCLLRMKNGFPQSTKIERLCLTLSQSP
ncbi:MAG: hypothetical protein MK135_13730, partial [Polyangiaceae bacterium]|nr:hypothetical protein [Polyangiaceae bacterium]